jgi:hypothetical protein
MVDKDTPADDIGTSQTPDYGAAALELFQSGFQPVPILPGTKKPAVKWKNGKFEMSARNIRRYWAKHPDHELAVILGPNTLVWDADTPEGVIALYMLEKSFDISPNVIVETNRGEHHYFRLAEGAFAKSDAPDKSEHPDRVDIKTGNALAIVPPSTGKRYGLREADSIIDLVEIDQPAIDAFYRHNGRDAPRKPSDTDPVGPPTCHDPGPLAKEIRNLLKHIDPNTGYEDWARVGMAIHMEFGGSDAGFHLFDEWSSQGEQYPGSAELVKKWRSFDGYTGTPVKLGTLYHLAIQGGAEIESLGEEFFTVIDDAEVTALADAPLPDHGLVAYSLRGMSSKFEAEMLDHRFILGLIAILGQWTVIYAPPNSGKTLLVLWLIIAAIRNGNIQPDDLFYVNADDNHQGLTAKLKLAEKHGFHMLAPGYRDFQAKNFLQLLRDLCASERAHGTIVILGTLKKFTDLMDKRTASEFGSAIREFIAQGGTMIGLAHVNKKRDADGKPVYSGTTDVVDDADCAFVLDVISDEGDLRTVGFENIKSRGQVAKLAVYRYSTAEGQSYTDLLASVEPVEEAEAAALKQAAAEFDEHDFTLIQAVQTSIRGGVTAKTKLIAEVMDSAGASRRKVEQVIEKFTGSDPEKDHWTSTRGARGLTTYELLPEPEIGDIVDLDGTAFEPAKDVDDDLDDEEVY